MILGTLSAIDHIYLIYWQPPTVARAKLHSVAVHFRGRQGGPYGQCELPHQMLAQLCWFTTHVPLPTSDKRPLLVWPRLWRTPCRMCLLESFLSPRSATGTQMQMEYEDGRLLPCNMQSGQNQEIWSQARQHDLPGNSLHWFQQGYLQIKSSLAAMYSTLDTHSLSLAK